MRATRRILVTLLLVTLVVALTLWRMTWMAPGWWAPPDPTDERAAALADGFEYGLIEQAHKIRPSGEPWRIEVTDRQVNAWLSGRLEAWIAHAHELHWPQQLGTGQLRDPNGADPQCVGKPWRNREKATKKCGLGLELALWLAPPGWVVTWVIPPARPFPRQWKRPLPRSS